jgi:hypothetical protein
MDTFCGVISITVTFFLNSFVIETVAQNTTFRVDRSLLKKVKQSRYTPWRRLGGEEV